MTDIVPNLESFYRLSKDIVTSLKISGGITSNEVRYMVDLYYTAQKTRIRLNNQVKGLGRDAAKEDRPEEPHELLDWGLAQFALFEKQVQRAMASYTQGHPMGWFFDQTLGVGPIISAGLLAHIDIRRAPTVGHIWSFAGLNPSAVWNKGKKRPWNASLKTLCWKAGDSFVKLSGREDAFYGQVYKQRKEYEIARNDRGGNEEQAKRYLTEKKWGKDTEGYKAYIEGKLPAGQLDARARRYAVKLFLSHLHWRWYEEEFEQAPPKPYILEHGGHVHCIEPPQEKPR